MPKIVTISDNDTTIKELEQILSAYSYEMETVTEDVNWKN